jgi:hypothetical protein
MYVPSLARRSLLASLADRLLIAPTIPATMSPIRTFNDIFAITQINSIRLMKLFTEYKRKRVRRRSLKITNTYLISYHSVDGLELWLRA